MRCSQPFSPDSRLFLSGKRTPPGPSYSTSRNCQPAQVSVQSTTVDASIASAAIRVSPASRRRAHAVLGDRVNLSEQTSFVRGISRAASSRTSKWRAIDDLSSRPVFCHALSTPPNFSRVAPKEDSVEQWNSARARVYVTRRSLSMFLALATVGLVIFQVEIASQTTSAVTLAKDPGVRGGSAGAGGPLGGLVGYQADYFRVGKEDFE